MKFLFDGGEGKGVEEVRGKEVVEGLCELTLRFEGHMAWHG